MQKQTSKWFFNIKASLTPIIMLVLTSNSRPIMAIENDNSQVFKKENLERDVKLDPQRLLKQSKITPSKKKLRNVKISIPNRKKDEMLEKKNLVLKEKPLLSTRPILKKDDFVNNFEITSVLYKIEKLNLSNRDKEHEIVTYWYFKNPEIKRVNKHNYYKLNDFSQQTIKINKNRARLKLNISNLYRAEEKVKKLRIKKFRRFNLLNLKIKFKIPTKRELRDACVDAITQVFKFKRWMHENVQRPFTKFVRSKTGNLIFNEPHVNPFIRKYGFEKLRKKTDIVNIKYEPKESILYRLKTYNRITFDKTENFSRVQNLGKCSKNGKILLPQKFLNNNIVILPQRYVKKTFKKKKHHFLPKKYYPDVKKGWFHFITKYFKEKRKLIYGLHHLEVLTPQSYKWKRKKIKTKSEIKMFRPILQYDKKWLTKRNQILKTSWRYKPYYHIISKKMFNEVKFRVPEGKKQELPNIFIGPELNKKRNKNLHSCAYGLGYFKQDNQKFYMNPSTGLFSYYVNTRNQIFNGDDKTTAYGIYKGQGYYIDKNNIKYFYKSNYKQTYNSWDYINDISPDGFPKARNNIYFYKTEYYRDKEYVTLKQRAGLWKDIRTTVRDKNGSLYPIEENKN